MKVHSLTILHYGKDYLPYALRSIYDSVDYCHIFYTPTPSHGHATDFPPVETKEDLISAAYAYDPDNKIRWYDIFGADKENVHRNSALERVAKSGAELVLVVDYDEIWPRVTLEFFLAQVWEEQKARNNLVNMIHFWRSFNWACHDENWPVRIIDLRVKRDTTAYLPYQTGRVFHFGYAVTDKVMQYKWLIHGHKNELRPNWFQEKWPIWPPTGDCHPTNDKGFWTPKPFDKTQLPEFMRAHPFYDLEMIG